MELIERIPLAKINYLYYLTPKGVVQKSKITLKFMKQTAHEYDELQKELNQILLIFVLPHKN